MKLAVNDIFQVELLIGVSYMNTRNQVMRMPSKVHDGCVFVSRRVINELKKTVVEKTNAVIIHFTAKLLIFELRNQDNDQ